MNLTKKISKLIFATIILTNIGSVRTLSTSNASELNITDSRCMGTLEQEQYIVTTGKLPLNLRTGPSTKSNVIAKIPAGSVITKISDFTNEWAKTVYRTPQGKEYIGYSFYGSGYAKKANFKKSEFGTITANRVIFRDSGSKTSKKLGYFYIGDQVDVVENVNSNGYYKVVITKATDKSIVSNIGYVHNDYFQKEKLI